MAEAGRCRACGGAELVEVIDLGETPIADILLTADQLAEPDPTFPLRVGLCPDCALLQLVELVDPDLLYRDNYPYYSSTVPGLVQHFGASAREILTTRVLTPESRVIEAASNDGCMLRVFAEAGVRVLGVDPAEGPAQVAIEAGVPTVVDFFTSSVADRIRSDGWMADVFLGNNVLNLVPDPADFILGLDRLLAPDGVAVLEVPYAVDAVGRCEYDNFFHQNCSYFSLTSLTRLVGHRSLSVIDVQRVATFGGSLRVWIGRGGTSTPAIERLLTDEARWGVADEGWYRDFETRALASRDRLVTYLTEQRALGKRVVAYGAAGGMATTLLSFAGVDAGLIEYAVDVNPHKHGLFTPGSRLQIFPPDRLLEDQPDLVLLLAWNYEREILEANREYTRRGGRFVVPIPEPRVVGAEGVTAVSVP